MKSRSRTLLFGYSLFLVLCGTAGLALSGFDLQQHFHGVRLAVVIAICGLLAGRFRRNPALAMLAIDFAAILILVMGLNYARLCLKWNGIEGPGWYTSYVAGSMALGSLLMLPLLLWSRPKTDRRAIEWWRPSPLITLPILVLIRFPRCRHGLGMVRRNGLTLGALMLIIGFVVTNSDRLPRRSAAVMFQTARLAQEHHELLSDILDDPQGLKQMLADPERLEEFLDDPRAQALIDDLTAEGGLLEGTDIAAVVERVAEGDLTALDEFLDGEGMSAAKSLLADISSEDSALSELLDDEQLAAAKTLLSRTGADRANRNTAMDDEARAAAKKLLSSAADSKSTKRQNITSVLQEVGGASGADFSGSLADLQNIDINDPKVQQALRKLNIDPEEAARLASSAVNAAGIESKLGQQMSTKAAILSRLRASDQSKLNSKLPSQRLSGDRIAAERLSSRLANQDGGTFGTGNHPRLGVRSIQVKSAPEKQSEPIEPTDVLAVADSPTDILQQPASETPPIEPNTGQPSAEPLVRPEAVVTALIALPDPTPAEVTSPQVDDQPTLVSSQVATPVPTDVVRNDPMEPSATSPTHLDPRLPPMAGTLFMLAGFLTIGVSLSRR